MSMLFIYQVDYDPRHEAFWFVGGTDVPASVLKWRKQYKWLREPDRLHEHIDRPVQYLGIVFFSYLVQQGGACNSTSMHLFCVSTSYYIKRAILIKLLLNLISSILCVKSSDNRKTKKISVNFPRIFLLCCLFD